MIIHSLKCCKITACGLVFAFLAVFSCSVFGLEAHACCQGSEKQPQQQMHCAQAEPNTAEMASGCFCAPTDQATVSTDSILPDLRHAAPAHNLAITKQLLSASPTSHMLALAHTPDESGRYLALRRLLN